MAKPPRQSGRKVVLSKEAAERIGRAVLAVERGDRSMGATTLRTAVGDDALVRGTFSGSWSKGTTKTVTDATLSAVTYEAKNYLATISPGSSMVCLIAYVAGEWVLAAWDWHSLPAYDATKQQVLTHAANGGLAWVNTTACT